MKLLNILLIVGIFMFLGCKQKEPPSPQQNLQPKPKPKPKPEKTTTTPKVSKLTVKSQDKKRADRMVDLLERLNKCLKSSVDSIRKVFKQTSISKGQYLNMKKLPKMCERSLFNIIYIYPDFSSYYKEYFILAADLLDTYFQSLELFMLPPDVPGKIPSSTLEKQVVNSYNKFATKNNELLGVPVLVKNQNNKKIKVGKRTFTYKLAKLSNENFKIMRNWQNNHSFNVPIGKDRPFWMNKLRKESVKIRLKELEVQKNIRKLKNLICVENLVVQNKKLSKASPVNKQNNTKIKLEAKTKTDEKVNNQKAKLDTKVSNLKILNCNVLNIRTKMFIDKTQTFFKKWKLNLKNAILSYPVIAKGFSKSVSEQFSEVSSIYQILPKLPK